MWPFGAAHGAVVGPAPVTSGQSLADMTRSDDVVGRVAQFGASTSRERGSNVVPTTRGNGRRGAEWPESLRGGSWGPGSTPGVQTGGAERSGLSPATGASPRRGPRTADEASPSPESASPAEAPESAGARGIAHGDMSDDAWTLGTDPRRRAGSEWVGALRRVQTALRPRDVEFKIGSLSSLLGCPLTPCPPGSKPPEMRSQGLGYRARLPRRCRPAPA